MARDWLKTLHRASYKGRAFFVETDVEAGGRRIVVHQFPMRDHPFLEDLGEDKREFTVTAYVASDRADSDATALMQICAQRGPGVVVLPTIGPRTVRCLTFRRTHAKDRLGYLAIELTFVREGFTSAVATVASLANLLFVLAEQTVETLAQTFATAVTVQNAPDYVTKTGLDGVDTALATWEAVRTTHIVDSAIGAAQRTAIAAKFATAVDVFATEDAEQIATLAQSVVTIASELGSGMAPDVALAAFADVLNETDPTVSTTVASSVKWKPYVLRSANAGRALLRIAALIAYCEAVGRISLGDRQSAITLRANVAEYFDAQLEALPSEDHELYLAGLKLRDITIEYLSRTILDLAPVATVSANLEMPSLYWAWRLYSDPVRSSELVSRNMVPHPSFMPLEFEALTR